MMMMMMMMMKRTVTKCHPNAEANPGGYRKHDQQEGVEKHGRKWNPRYEWSSEVKFGIITRLTDDHNKESKHTDQT